MKTKMLDLMLSEAAMGVEEVKGPEANPRIMEYLGTTTIKATDDITPWCSACVNWVAIQAGYNGTDSAASATWKSWGKKLKKPARGCVIGFVRNDGSGHVGIFISEDDDTYTILGGNQADMIKTSRFKKSKSGEPRDWYFRVPKVVLNSKSIATGSGGLLGTGVTIAYPEIIAQFKESQETVTSLSKDVAELKSESWTDTFNDVMPYLTLIMFGYLIYERYIKLRDSGA